MVDFAVVSERTALINVDMQNCFVEGYPSSAPDGLAVLGALTVLLPSAVRRAFLSFIRSMCCNPTARMRAS